MQQSSKQLSHPEHGILGTHKLGGADKRDQKNTTSHSSQLQNNSNLFDKIKTHLPTWDQTNVDSLAENNVEPHVGENQNKAVSFEDATETH